MFSKTMKIAAFCLAPGLASARLLAPRGEPGQEVGVELDHMLLSEAHTFASIASAKTATHDAGVVAIVDVKVGKQGVCYEAPAYYASACLLKKSPVVKALMKEPQVVIQGACKQLGYPHKLVIDGGVIGYGDSDVTLFGNDADLMKSWIEPTCDKDENCKAARADKGKAWRKETPECDSGAVSGANDLKLVPKEDVPAPTEEFMKTCLDVSRALVVENEGVPSEIDGQLQIICHRPLFAPDQALCEAFRESINGHLHEPSYNMEKFDFGLFCTGIHKTVLARLEYHGSDSSVVATKGSVHPYANP